MGKVIRVFPVQTGKGQPGDVIDAVGKV